VLGLTNASWDNDDFTSVNDVEQLHRQLKERGVPIRSGPTNHPWALEIHVDDPDGNVLRFGSEPKS